MEPGDSLTPGGIIGHANGAPGLVAFRLPSGRILPLAVHHPDGSATPIACQRCGDTRRADGTRCPACRPAPQRPATGL